MYYSVGVDPGTGDGAIVLLAWQDDGTVELKGVWDMPSRVKSTTRKRNRRGQMSTYSKREVDPIALNNIMGEINRIVNFTANVEGVYAAIEAVHAMPAVRKDKATGEEKKQGIASTAQFMDSYGVARALLECWFPGCFERVAPQTWKKMFSLTGQDKDAARKVAITMFGDTSFTRKKDVGRADAALIAYFPIIKRLKEKQ